MSPSGPAEQPLGYFVHEKAICESSQIGPRTRIWAFAHILPKARVGADCNICDHVFLENDVIVGDRVTIKSGVQLWDGIRVEDDVFIGPNATFTNDKFPRSKQYQDRFPQTLIRKGASIGANSTILPGVTVGSWAVVGAGSVVTHDVPRYAVVVGNPARIMGYAATRDNKLSSQVARPQERTNGRSVVAGVRVLTMPYVKDLRGSLSAGEFTKELPFVPKRYFIVFDVPSRHVRGEHAHRRCHQLLVCVSGSCSVVVDDGDNREEITLDQPNLGVYVPPMIWASQYKYSADAVLLVFASEPYDPADYIRDYDQFLGEREPARSAEPQ